MKTTLDLPDNLMRDVKIRAVRENKRLKDEVAELIERGLKAAVIGDAPTNLPKPVRLKRGGPLTIDAIESAINGGRD